MSVSIVTEYDFPMKFSVPSVNELNSYLQIMICELSHCCKLIWLSPFDKLNCYRIDKFLFYLLFLCT